VVRRRAGQIKAGEALSFTLGGWREKGNRGRRIVQAQGKKPADQGSLFEATIR